MAKLSTPSHPCQQQMVNGETGQPMRCLRPAYRRHGGRWLCLPHTRMARRREAR